MTIYFPGKINEPEKSSAFKTSTPKPTSSLQKSSFSKETRDQNDSTADKSGDFWSSFLGTSDSSPKNKEHDKTSSKVREPLGRKKSDSKLATERQSKKSVSRKRDVDEVKNDVSGKSNLLDITQDNILDQADKKKRNIKTKEKGIRDVKAKSNQQTCDEQSSKSNVINNKAQNIDVASQSVKEEETFVNVCLGQTSPNLVDNGDDNETISSPKTQKIDVNKGKSQEEMEIENRTSLGEFDNDIEDGNSESIKDSESSLELMATSTPLTNSKEPPPKASTILEPNERLNERLSVSSSDPINAREKEQNSDTVSKEEEVQNSDTSTINTGQEIQNSDAINVGEEVQNSHTSDIDVEEVQTKVEIGVQEEDTNNTIEEVQDNGNIVDVSDGLSTSDTRITKEYNDNEQARKEPCEGDCEDEVVQGIVFKAEDVLQEESYSEFMVDNEDNHQTCEEDGKLVDEAGAGDRDIKESSDELPTEESNINDCDIEKQAVTEHGDQNLQVHQLIKVLVILTFYFFFTSFLAHLSFIIPPIYSSFQE